MKYCHDIKLMYVIYFTTAIHDLRKKYTIPLKSTFLTAARIYKNISLKGKEIEKMI